MPQMLREKGSSYRLLMNTGNTKDGPPDQGFKFLLWLLHICCNLLEPNMSSDI